MLDIYSRLIAKQRQLEDLKAARKRALEKTTCTSTSQPSNRSSSGSARHQPDPAGLHTSLTSLAWRTCLRISGPGSLDGCNSCPCWALTPWTHTASDKEPNTTKKHRKLLKSGKLGIADTQVVSRLEWPHELVYMADGRPAEYETLSISLFISGYMKITDRQKPDIKSPMSASLAYLMVNSERYGWEALCAFHAIWIQQLDQGRTSW